MILKSIKVANWRCLLGTVDVPSFSEGITILFAPNGTGKTTLFEALRFALFDAHSTAAQEAKAIRPWGRDLAPTVTVEFVHGGTGYRVNKRFLSSPSCTLDRNEAGQYRPLAEGADAEQHLRSFFTKNPPLRGIARPENLGLAQVLWAPQGDLALPGLSGDLVSDIQALLGRQLAGPGSGPIEKIIEQRYGIYFAPQGKPRAGSPVLALEKQLDAAGKALMDAKALHTQFEEVSRKVEDVRARRAQASHEAHALAETLAREQERLREFQRLDSERRQLLDRCTAAQAEYDSIKQRIDLIADTEKQLAEVRTDAARLEADVPLRLREMQAREQESQRARAVLEDARIGREAVDQAERLADDARRFAEVAEKLSALDQSINRIDLAGRDIADRKAQRGAVTAPDAKKLKAIRKAMKERDDAKTAIEASLLTLEIVPEAGGEIDVLAGEQTGRLTLVPGQPMQIKGSPEVVVHLPNVARLRASGPTGSIEEQRNTYAKADKKVSELTEPYGTADEDALEALSERASQLDAGINQAAAKLEALLADRRPDALRQERAELQAQRTALARVHPDWDQAPPDAVAVKATAESAKKAFVKRVEAAEADRDKASSASSASQVEHQRASDQLASARKSFASLESRRADASNDGRTPDERRRLLQERAIAWEAGKAKLEEVKKSLHAFGDDPRVTVKTLEAQASALAEGERKAREDEVRQQTLLEGLCARGPYSVLAEAEENAERVKDQLAAERVRAEAIRLLRTTVVACREEAISAVTGPVEEAATAILHRIAGSRIGAVGLATSFSPEAMRLDALDEPVSVANLSGGEREQLYLATRLALAGVLAQRGRELVVLDDVLTATDSARLARILRVLEEAAQLNQIVVLTCHPERYRGLPSGQFMDFEGLVQAGG